ncbi:MAG: hypothetical protein N3A02_01815 [Rectinema sp.]|nr:hypothetical protein [Rectinema sp.]
MRSYQRVLASVLLCCSTQLPAETVDWQLGQTIEVLMPVSTPEQPNIRTIVFPLAAVDAVIGFHDDQDLDYQVRDNTISLRLKNPGFSGNLQVFDKNGNLFVFRIKPLPRAQSGWDEVIFLRSRTQPVPTAAGGGGADTGWPSDPKVASTIMLAHVFGDRKHPAIFSAPVSSLVDGKKVDYVTITATDEFELRLIRAWSSPTITGALCQLIVRSEKPIVVDYRSIYPRNVVGIHAEYQTVFDPVNPKLRADPGQVVNIFYTMLPQR